MATLYGAQATKRLNTVPEQLVEQGYGGGRIHVLSDSYTLTADLTAADVIKMGKLPKGARVVDVRFVYPDLDASGGTVDVGWQASAELAAGVAVEAADADGFMAAVDVTSAGTKGLAIDSPTRPGFQKVFAAEVEVVLATVGDTDATTGTVYLDVYYTID